MIYIRDFEAVQKTRSRVLSGVKNPRLRLEFYVIWCLQVSVTPKKLTKMAYYRVPRRVTRCLSFVYTDILCRTGSNKYTVWIFCTTRETRKYLLLISTRRKQILL